MRPFLRRTAGRTAVFLISIVIASIVVFAFMTILPGDPARVALGVNASPEAVEGLGPSSARTALCPSSTSTGWQACRWATSALPTCRGQRSDHRSSTGYWSHLWLVVTSMVVSTLFAVPLGILAALRHRHNERPRSVGLSQIGIAIPGFVAGIALIFFFAVKLQLFPSGGWTPPAEDPIAFFKQLRAAGAVPRTGSGRDPDPLHPLGRAGRAAGGLHPDRQGQGVGRLPDAGEARAAQRSHPRRHRPRPPADHAADRCRGHRARLRHPGPRQPAARRAWRTATCCWFRESSCCWSSRRCSSTSSWTCSTRCSTRDCGVHDGGPAPAAWEAADEPEAKPTRRPLGPTFKLGCRAGRPGRPCRTGVVRMDAVRPGASSTPRRGCSDQERDHWLGTDKFGRDVFSQLLVGARTTLFVGIIAVAVAAVIGIPIGHHRRDVAARRLSEILMRANDLVLAFPGAAAGHHVRRRLRGRRSPR